MQSNYWIAYGGGGQFFLWEGPIKSDSNLHYAKFYGVRPGDGGDIWVLERTDKPENAMELRDDLAIRMFGLVNEKVRISLEELRSMLSECASNAIMYDNTYNDEERSVKRATDESVDRCKSGIIPSA